MNLEMRSVLLQRWRNNNDCLPKPQQHVVVVDDAAGVVAVVGVRRQRHLHDASTAVVLGATTAGFAAAFGVTSAESRIADNTTAPPNGESAGCECSTSERDRTSSLWCHEHEFDVWCVVDDRRRSSSSTTTATSTNSSSTPTTTSIVRSAAAAVSAVCSDRWRTANLGLRDAIRSR